jgi:hypothetical protein
MFVRIIKRRIPGPSDIQLYSGTVALLPRVGDRVTFDTRHGPRTYKVSRITHDITRAIYTLEVVKVESAYVD